MSASQRRKGAAEEWRRVNTHGGIFADRYEVSSLGRVRAAPRMKAQGSKPGRVLSQGTDDGGYRQVILHFGGCKRKTIKVHRIVAEAFLGPRAEGQTVDHIDCDKENNHAVNLEYVTSIENLRRAVSNGLLRGKRAHNKGVGLKINAEIAASIRARVHAGQRRADIAEDFGIHVMTVGEIVRGEIWAP